MIASSVPSMPSTAALRSASKPAGPVTKLRTGLPVGFGAILRIAATSRETDSVSSLVEMTGTSSIVSGESLENADGGFSGPRSWPMSPHATPPGPPTPWRFGSDGDPQIRSTVSETTVDCS